MLFRHIREAHPEPPLTSAPSQTPALLSAVKSAFCDSCLERQHTCVCCTVAPAVSATVPACPAIASCCAINPVLTGESAVEAILDDQFCHGMPIMPSSKEVKKVHFDPHLNTCLYEVCCSPTSMLGRVSSEYSIPHIRFHKDEFNILSRNDIDELKCQISGTNKPATFVSLPCTDWTQWQNVNCHVHGPEYRKALAKRRHVSRRMLRNALEVGELTLSLGGDFVFEWPRSASGWKLPELLSFIQKHNLMMIDFDGCAVGLTDAEGTPHLKRWRFITQHSSGKHIS